VLPIDKPHGLSWWIRRWTPSTTLRFDPLHDTRVEGRYVPIPIAGWKLTPVMARALVARRVFKPLTFLPGRRLAVIVPVRDREAHLAVLIPRLVAALREQGIDHRIVVVEQEHGKLWNKGAMINTGLRHCADGCDYVCLHDVDAVPLSANYLCPSQPLRLVTKLTGSLQGDARPPRYFGGVITLLREQAFAANGFSNGYWAWGKEDDDFLFRLLFAGFVCYSDPEGSFEDLHNPAHQQVDLERLFKPRTLRRNRRRRSLLLRGLVDPAEDGVSVVTTEIVRRTDDRGYERLLVRC
jgi:hypothetical protein